MAEAKTGATNGANKNRRVRLVILIVGSLLVVAMAYGSGMRGEQRIAKRIDEQRKLAQQDLREAQRTARLRLAVAEMLEGRRQVALALTELDRRNFGVAQEHLTQAAKRLSDAQDANTTSPDMTALLTRLKATSLVAAADIGGQRDNLTALAADMDKALDGYIPTFVDGGLADDKAHPIKNPTMNDVPQLPGNDVTRVQ